MKSVTMNGATTTSPIGLEKMPTAMGSAAQSGCLSASSAIPARVSARASTKGSWPCARYSVTTSAKPHAGHTSSIFHMSRTYR